MGVAYMGVAYMGVAYMGVHKWRHLKLELAWEIALGY